MAIWVADINVLQRNADELEARLASGDRIVLTTEALAELVKGHRWLHTLQKSLSALATRPSRVHIGKSIPTALRWEKENGASITGRLLHREASASFRSILSGLASHREPRDYLDMAAVEAWREALTRQLFDHDANRDKLLSLVSTSAETLPEWFVTGLRRGTITDSDRLNTIKSESEALLHSRFSGFGYTNTAIKSFIRRKPLTLRWGYVRLWYSCEWIRLQGVRSVKPAAATNEAIDSRHVCAASFFDGLLSRETEMQRALADLVAILGETRQRS